MSFKEQIIAPIREELTNFEPYFQKATKSDLPLLSTIINFILRRKGKQMRPMMVFLAAKLNGTFNERTYHAALTIELLHTATLVHDDVVDDSYQRRGFFSINAVWKNKIAELVGDFFGRESVVCTRDVFDERAGVGDAHGVGTEGADADGSELGVAHHDGVHGPPLHVGKRGSRRSRPRP